MKKKGILSLVVLLLVSCTVVAQVGFLSGLVKAAGGPVAAATVTANRKTVVADRDGRFRIGEMQAGKLRLQVSAAGYLPLDTNVYVQPGMQPLQLFLQQGKNIMEEVVVSGTMKAVSRMASPIPVEVYSPAFFKKNPTPSIFEGLQMVNGVQPQLNCNVCNTGDIHINGMEGPYTMVLIDGMPIVSSLSTVYGLSGIPNSMVKRIEIVKGPASTLYGSEAVGGVINIITKDPAGADKLRVDFSATNIGEYNADISTRVNLNKASALVGINYFNFNNRLDINNDNFTDIALQNRLSVFNKWNIDLPGDATTSLALRYIYENRWGGEMQWQQKFAGTDSVYGESIRTNRVEVISTTAFNKNLSADFSYNYHRQQSYYGTVPYFATQQVGFAQLRWGKKLNRHDLLAGLPLRYTFYDDNTPGTAAVDGKNRPDKSFLPGIFVQDEFTIHPALTILAGLRYDYNNRHGSIVTPRLSCKYSPNSNNTIRLSMGNGYRVVNLFTEDHAALTGAREVVIAATLRPERSWNWNVNYSSTIRHSNGFLNVDVSAFYTYFTNKIVADYLTDANKIIYDNLTGYAVSKGISINTDCNFTNGIKILAGATLMDVYRVDRNDEGKKLKTPQLFAPAVSGTFAVSYTIAKQKITFDLTGRINGPMYLPVVANDFRDEQSPLFGILNLQVSKLFGNGMELYGGVKNLLNFIPANPLLHPDDPFDRRGGRYFDNNGAARPDTNPNGYSFDPSYNYAAIQGARVFAGIRWSIK